MNFILIEFLRCLNVVEYDDSCQKVMGILLNAPDESLGDHLSDDEIITLRRNMKEALRKLVLVNHALEVEQVFLIHSRCAQAEKLDSREKERVISEVLPDIPEICEIY